MALPDTRAMLVADSIYCCIEILKQCGNYGLSSHIINHSLVAGAHEKCAWWIAEYRKVTVQAEEWLAAHMPSYFGQEWEQVVSERRRVEHLRSAFRQYGMALDAHRGGPAYRALIENLVYLNEDLGDDLTHFCAAQERYWLHGGRTRKRIKVLEDELAAYLKEKPVRPSRPPEPDRGQAPTRQDLRGLPGSAGEPSTL